MNTKIGIVILAVICIGLAVGLIATKKQIDEQRKTDADKILDFSNQLITANATLDELRQVNLMLTNDLADSRQQSVALSNNLAGAEISLQNNQSQITNLNAQIMDLEAQNQALDLRAAQLTNTIVNLSDQIAATERELANSETNDAFLTSELQRQMAQRAELEHKFNDLNELRTQVKKIKTDLFVARRLDWMRNGIDPSAPQVKGGQLLTQHTATNNIAPARPPHYDLNVEVGSDGSVHVIPPLTTNTPATNATSQ